MNLRYAYISIGSLLIFFLPFMLFEDGRKFYTCVAIVILFALGFVFAVQRWGMKK